MSNEYLETVKLTARFKIKEIPNELTNIFPTYKTIVNNLLNYAFKNNITSFKRLKSEKYKDLRGKYKKLPSHYLYTACQMATSIFKSWRKRHRKGKASKKPDFKGSVIMLDDHLFKLDLDKGLARISTPYGRVEVELYSSDYHKKFKDWKVGQAWIVRKKNDYYLNVVFSKNILIKEGENVVGVDLNENNVTIATDENIIQIITNERTIRTSYYVKRRKIQEKIRLGDKKKELLEKYGERERNKIVDIYHKVANKIIEIAKKVGGVIALENLKEIREKVNYFKKLNGRLHRWSFRKLQEFIKYKAKLNGVRVVFVNPHYTSSRCPICGGRMSPNGHRVLKCECCGCIADRDVVGSLNIMIRGFKAIKPKDVGSSVPPESYPMKLGGWKVIRYACFNCFKISG
ncbi:RNA-guided endonuclease InsQ/TnpB family protein [Methanotorris formicicus]|uniref:Transposase, IS605 OrfB family n=1 Tax=Methanotorris formicicus Mc-S-70 TaxID=647171 RepID=H1KWK8_9EURY|nr:RNA-guided endonuclease TnpB family protein [Methanotorris formicicus]EHP89123.1 transposase, IS605 OrfB family [Methanotorris formicicus Mc-S-70]